MKIPITEIKFDEHGLIPAIIQDAKTLQVLTLAYTNAESLKRTIETNETWFWSRSRSSLWHKGETSGHTQNVLAILADCDSDALIVLVNPNGPACHTGEHSCFHNALQEAADNFPERLTASQSELGDVLDGLYALVESRRREKPEGSYTTYLFDEGLDKILKKVGEESSETIIAAKNQDRDALVKEVSDLLYHLVVLMVEREVALADIHNELARRKKKRDAL